MNSVFVVASGYDYEGLGSAVAAFTTRPAAEAWVAEQERRVGVMRAWRDEEPRMYRTARDAAGPLFLDILQSRHAAWEARRPFVAEPLDPDVWDITEVEVLP